MTFKDYLNDKCINQSQLARKLGVDRQVITSWARGVAKPRPLTMLKLANALEVPYEEILNIFYGEHVAKMDEVAKYGND